jgi:hypothetical protein
MSKQGHRRYYRRKIVRPNQKKFEKQALNEALGPAKKNKNKKKSRTEEEKKSPHTEETELDDDDLVCDDSDDFDVGDDGYRKTFSTFAQLQDDGRWSNRDLRREIIARTLALVESFDEDRDRETFVNSCLWLEVPHNYSGVNEMWEARKVKVSKLRAPDLVPRWARTLEFCTMTGLEPTSVPHMTKDCPIASANECQQCSLEQKECKRIYDNLAHYREVLTAEKKYRMAVWKAEEAKLPPPPDRGTPVSSTWTAEDKRRIWDVIEQTLRFEEPKKRQNPEAKRGVQTLATGPVARPPPNTRVNADEDNNRSSNDNSSNITTNNSQPTLSSTTSIETNRNSKQLTHSNGTPPLVAVQPRTDTIFSTETHTTPFNETHPSTTAPTPS